MESDWSSYDSAATTHSRLGVPSMFAGPARDLVARMGPSDGAAWLDAGTGTGIVATFAQGALVTGLDPSIGMLRVARENGVARVVAGMVPGLPFPDESFDRVTAAFVLSHIGSYAAALQDMHRVLRPGGRLGVTAWGVRSNEYRDLWDSLAEQAVGKDLVRAAAAKALPWEDWLGHPENLQSALEEAGLKQVTVDLVTYPIHITLADFLATREASLIARFLRKTLDAAGWERFRETAAAEFHGRYRDSIDHTRDALIGVGTKP